MLNKMLLALIAVALWIIALNPWLRPAPVAAASAAQIEVYDYRVVSTIRSIESYVTSIANGLCLNNKLC
jgi:hypothetical protein